jgi:hypothetical protein
MGSDTSSKKKAKTSTVWTSPKKQEEDCRVWGIPFINNLIALDFFLTGKSRDSLYTKKFVS